MGKFDDIPKASKSVLNDDYQTSGYLLKAKQKTSFDGAVISTDVDLFPAKGDQGQTPAKLSWKFPKPFGLGVLVIDKLELNKAGQVKLETSSDKIYPGLKVEVKSDLIDKIDSLKGGATFTGVKDTQIKIETKLTNPSDFTCEVTRSQAGVTFGLKGTMASLMKAAPDVGACYQKGPFFGALMVSKAFSVYTGYLMYQATDQLKLAGTFDPKKKSYTAGLLFTPVKGTTVKAKFQDDQSVHVGVKHEVSKGFTALCGCKVDTKTLQPTYGLQLSIE